MVRPIELPDLLSKTTLAEKVTQIQKSAPDIAQRNFASELEQKAAEREKKSVPTSKTDEAIIHREKDKKEDKRKKKKKKSDKKGKQQRNIDLKA